VPKSQSFLKPMMLLATTAVLLSSPASSRQWKATPEALARDYGQIVDSRGVGEIIVLSWMVPQGIPMQNPGAPVMRDMLQHYVLVLAVHSQFDKTTGAVSFKDGEEISLKDQAGKPLTPVARETLPPTNIAMITAMEAVFKQSLGQMGAGMKAYLFNAAGADACKKGQLAAQFAGETYTWDTPFPGCDGKN
jgi:hypothetical protein